MHVNGVCHCGEIEFKASIAGDSVICHCVDCQILSGSAFRINVKAEASTFSLLKGELKNYIKIADSGDKRVQAFCATCATPIYSSVESNPQYLFLRIGVIKQRQQIKPSVQIWQKSALCQFLKLDKVPALNEQQALDS